MFHSSHPGYSHLPPPCVRLPSEDCGKSEGDLRPGASQRSWIWTSRCRSVSDRSPRSDPFSILGGSRWSHVSIFWLISLLYSNFPWQKMICLPWVSPRGTHPCLTCHLLYQGWTGWWDNPTRNGIQDALSLEGSWRIQLGVCLSCLFDKLYLD